MKNGMKINIKECEGKMILTTIIDGFIFKRTYMGYSVNKALRAFEVDLKGVNIK